MSDEQKNNQNNNNNSKDAKAGSPLPGLGKKPAGSPLPGLGKKPAGGPLPGLGGKAAPVPPFGGQPEPEGPNPEEVARDPFAQPPARSSVAPPPVSAMAISASSESIGEISDAAMGRGKSLFVTGGSVIGLLALIIGYLAASSISKRAALNIAIRDALIVEYEIKKSAKLFGEVQTVINTALQKTAKRKFDPNHLSYLSDNVHGSPMRSTIFTERNYKTFDPSAVQWLMDYSNKWSLLADLIMKHRNKTNNDIKMLKASGAEFMKLLETNYGVVFTRDKKQDGKFLANLVVMGTCEEGKKGGFECMVQQDTGTFGDKRILYNPPPEDVELTKEPDIYVVEIGANSKAGILQNATQSHFKSYVTRLREMSDLTKKMGEIQSNLLDKISRICSQDPVGFLGGLDPVEEYNTYVDNDKKISAAKAQ